MAELGHLQIKEAVRDLVSFINRLCTGDSDESSPRDIVGRVKDFLRMIPRDNYKKSMEHLQIFEFYWAPEALVSLFSSPIQSYKEIAEESIRLFLNPEICKLPRSIQNQCASIVSEFALCLRAADAYDDPLHSSCRQTIGYLLRSMGFANRSRYFGNAKAFHLIKCLHPFASQLSTNLIEGLASIRDSSSLSNCLKLSFESDICEFALFSLHLRRAIEDHFRSNGQSLPLCLDDNFESHPCYLKEIQQFYGIFKELLTHIEISMCLMVHEINRAEGAREFNHGWSYYLHVLKELNNFSKLYQGAEEKLSSAMRLFKFPLHILVKHSKRSDDHQWLLKLKDVIYFESRMHLMTMMFPEVKDEDEKLNKMVIDRSQLLTESFEHIARANPKSLHNGILMEFKDEVATGHGVL